MLTLVFAEEEQDYLVFVLHLTSYNNQFCSHAN